MEGDRTLRRISLIAMSMIASLSSSHSVGARSISWEIVARRARKPGPSYLKPFTHDSTNSLANNSFLSDAFIKIETAYLAASGGVP